VKNILLFMNLETFFSVILVSSLTLIGNVAFFNYRFRKDNKWKIRQQQITELIQPLYYLFKEDEFFGSEWSHLDSYEPTEFYAEEPKRLKEKILPIIKGKLYLADDELHSACIIFLDWAHNENYEQRYQNIQKNSITSDSVYSDFKKMVFKKYDETRKKYLKNS